MKWFLCVFLLRYLVSQSIAKSAFCDGYFACYFGCCESGTFRRHTYLLRQVQFTAGYRIYGRLSALWNVLKSHQICQTLTFTVTFTSTMRGGKKWLTVDFRDDTLRKAYFCGFIIIFHVIKVKLLLVPAKLSGSISPQVYRHQLLWQTNSCSYIKSKTKKKKHNPLFLEIKMLVSWEITLLVPVSLKADLFLVWWTFLWNK